VLVDEAAIGIEVVEVIAAAQEQRIAHGVLEVAVRALDGAVLMVMASMP